MFIHEDNICKVIKIGDNYFVGTDPENKPFEHALKFQYGSPSINGYNGFTIEAVLSACIDRLECFNSGNYKCDYNDVALDGMKAARHALMNRIASRIENGTYEG